MGNLNLINISLPVKMFEPRSYLQKLADAWLYTSWLQARAAAAARGWPAKRCRGVPVRTPWPEAALFRAIGACTLCACPRRCSPAPWTSAGAALPDALVRL